MTPSRLHVPAVSLRRTVALWVTLAVTLRAVWLTVVPPVAVWDGVVYARTALRIAQGLGFVDTWNNLPPYPPTAFYPVGYPALLALSHRVFAPSLWNAGLLNLLAAALTVGGIVALARRALGPGREHLPAALYTLAPGAVMYTSAVMTETVSGALVTLTALLAARHADRGARRDALGAGILLGLGGLVRPQVLALGPLLAWMAAPWPGWKSRARTMALLGAMACVVVLPWTVRNCVQLDGCALVSVNGGSNLWIGTDPSALGTYRELRRGEGCDRVLGEVAKDRCYARKARARILADPFAWLALVPMKVHALLDYETAPVEYLQEAGVFPPARAESLGRWSTGWHRITLALALLGLVSVRSWTTALRLCAAMVLGMVALHGIFFGSDRYHLVFAPLVCVMAGTVLPMRVEARSAPGREAPP